LSLTEHVVVSLVVGAFWAGVMYFWLGYRFTDEERLKGAVWTFLIASVFLILLGDTEVNCAAYPSLC